MNVDRLAVDDGAAGWRASTEGSSAFRHRHRPVRSHVLKDVTIGAINQNISSIAQPCSSRRDRIEHRLNVRWRTGNYTENFTRGSLLLQRLLQLLEQAHVFDGDDSLIGKGLQKLDLRRGERTHVNATRVQQANEITFLVQGNGQESANVGAGT